MASRVRTASRGVPAGRRGGGRAGGGGGGRSATKKKKKKPGLTLRESNVMEKVANCAVASAQSRLHPLFLTSLWHYKVRFIGAGFDHIILATECGRAFSMGENAAGQLGHGHKDNISKPVQISGLAHEKIRSAAGGLRFSLCLTEKGEVYSFGDGGGGQLGLGNHVRKEPR